LQEDALENEIVTPASDLQLNNTEKEEYDQGLIFEKCPQILIKGHLTLRVQKMASRAEYSKYLFMPTKFSFRKVVRVTASIFKYLKKTGLVTKSEDRFRMFVVQNLKENLSDNVCTPPWQSSWGGGRLSGTGCSPATTPGCEGGRKSCLPNICSEQ
jgi:hypothetical protein